MFCHTERPLLFVVRSSLPVLIVSEPERPRLSDATMTELAPAAPRLLRTAPLKRVLTPGVSVWLLLPEKMTVPVEVKTELEPVTERLPERMNLFMRPRAMPPVCV